MPGLLTARGVIAAKTEATEGTAESLTATEATTKAENVMLSFDLPWHERKAVSASLSAFPGTMGGPRLGRLTFDVQIAGSGTAGTAPSFGDLLEACGFTETVVPVTSVTYTPDSDCASCTVAAYLDGTIHTLTGARGTVSFDLNAGDPGIMHFEFQGAAATYTDGAILAPTFETTVPVANVGGAFLFDSLAMKYRSFSINMGNRLTPRHDATKAGGCFSVALVGRDVRGSIDPELVTSATYNYFTKATANTQVAVSLPIGATAGNICTVTAPKVQYSGLSLGDRDGLRTANCDLYFARSASAGEDELSIAFT